MSELMRQRALMEAEKAMSAMPDAFNGIMNNVRCDINLNRETRHILLQFSLTPLPFIKLTIPMTSLEFIGFAKECQRIVNMLGNGETDAESQTEETATPSEIL